MSERRVERERTEVRSGRADKTATAVNITVGYEMRGGERGRGLEIALADFISGQIILRGSVLPFVPSLAPPLAPPLASPPPPSAFDVINATLDVDADGADGGVGAAWL